MPRSAKPVCWTSQRTSIQGSSKAGHRRISLLTPALIHIEIDVESIATNPRTLSGNEVKVVVIADPQIMDRTLNLAPKSFALEAAQFFTDLYMRRWSESLNRFKHIFDLEGHGRYSNIAVYYVCGNHDIGYSHFHMKNPEVIHRYEKEFGARNYRFSAGKVDFIVVDAQTLDGQTPTKPKTTIPPEKDVLNKEKKQIYLGSSLKTYRQIPELSYEGVFRSFTELNQTPVQHTLGTISWQQGNLYPSFILLTGAAAEQIEGDEVDTEHHCRRCGRTLCNEHSSNQMALPQFGIHSNVRVCDDCYNDPSWTSKVDDSNTSAVVVGISRLHVNGIDIPEAVSTSCNAASNVVVCKCGMPLCICEPPHQIQCPHSASSNQSNPRSKKPSPSQQTAESISRKASSSSKNKPSSFLSMGQAGNDNMDKPKADYDVSGEGIREAIKNSDIAAVRKLLSEGVDANYCDRQGLTLLHLAAVFNQTEIAFILMDHGASVERKNAQAGNVGVKMNMGSIEKMDPELDGETLDDSPLGVRKMHTFEHIGSLAAVAQSYGSGRGRNRLWMSIYTVIFKAKINMLLPFGPLAIILHYLTEKHGWVFFFSLVGITPLAERLGYATEQLAFYTGPTVGGLLNATFGNATEMIISVYALRNGMVRVVQQSLLGSILSNMLLVLGCAFFCGGIVHSAKNRSSIRIYSQQAAAVVNSGLLLMAVMGLTFPAVLHFTHSEVQYGKSEVFLSRFSSCIMLVAYASYLFFSTQSQHNPYSLIEEEERQTVDDTDDDDVPEITLWESVAWLAILTTWVSILSGYLVDAIQGASEAMNMPVAFISVILLPIVGNAAEHASAIMFAIKDKLDITLGVAIGSSTQISMFLIPFCVVIGWMMGKGMDLNFQLFETATLFITVLVVAFYASGRHC
ncbi:hypothetical protein HPP92_002174 [Vanilla planifolia]|uniref:FYVE-type domain-containing protein n=1 Tax=Vanilla planifolia TaxID=51239 RepID=A0A835VHN5_VANPL|nr:hypothetical protein HPP92_002174 [Vanilla planifolia]